MALQPEKFLQRCREIVGSYRGCKVQPYDISKILQKLPPEWHIRSEVGFINHSEDLSLGHSKSEIEDRITAETGYLLNVRAANDRHTAIQGITNIAILIYSDLHHFDNKYATVFFDLDKETIYRVQLNNNGKKMVPEIQEIEGDSIDQGLETLFKVVYDYRNKQKVPFCYHRGFGVPGQKRNRSKLVRRRARNKKPEQST